MSFIPPSKSKLTVADITLFLSIASKSAAEFLYNICFSVSNMFFSF